MSGFVGVLAEQVFEKLLSVVVGASTPSAATVLAVYFLGLSLGGYLASLLVKRKVSAVMGYCIAELGVALCSLWLLLTFDTGTQWYSRLIAWGAGDAMRLVVARASIAGLIILPTALCLGLSFPFLGSLAAQAEKKATYYLAKLYCINLFGAALCALAAPFLIFPKVGLSGALLICVAVDASVALYAAWLSRSIDFVAESAEQSAGFKWESSDAMILAVAFISGLLFFALEVIWTHLAGVVIGTSVYAFSSMLFVVLIGLARGSLQIGRTAERGGTPASLHELFFRCSALMLLQVAFWPYSPLAMVSLGMHAFNFYAGEAVRLIVLLALLLPVACAYGMIYPSLFQGKRFERPGAGALLGYMTGANAMGCVLGAIGATFFLIPHVGSEWSLRVVEHVFAIICEKISQTGTAFFFGCAGAQSLFYQALRPAPHVTEDLLVRERRAAHFFYGGAHGQREVQTRIDERAIQVKDQRADIAEFRGVWRHAERGTSRRAKRLTTL